MFHTQNARGEPLLVVVGLNGQDGLTDDRASVELGCHPVDGGSMEQNTCLERPAMRVQARKGREQRGVHIDHAPLEELEKACRNDPHEACHHHQIRIATRNHRREFSFKIAAIGVALRLDQKSGELLFPRPGKPRTRTVGNDSNNRSRSLLGLDLRSFALQRLLQRNKVRAATRNHHNNPLRARRADRVEPLHCQVFRCGPSQHCRFYNRFTMRIIRRPVDSGHAVDSIRVDALPCVLTIGNFDGVHLGHQALLRAVVDRARQRSVLAALLSFWPHPRHYFARRDPQLALAAPPRLSSRREQWKVIAQCGIERLFALRFDETLAMCPAETFIRDYLVRGIRAQHLVVGDDFRFGANRRGDFEMLRREGAQWGFSVESIQSVLLDQARVSSSQVREALAQGRFDRAEELLGRPYSISGHVVHGRKLGRELGFPTLNLRIDGGTPALQGVFVVRVFGLRSESAVAGVASLGTRPAVESGGRFLLEVHLLDWDQDVYGRIVQVEFLHKLRDEAHYPTLEALRAQIAHDQHAAIAYHQKIALPS